MPSSSRELIVLKLFNTNDNPETTFQDHDFGLGGNLQDHDFGLGGKTMLLHLPSIQISAIEGSINHHITCSM